MKKSLFIASTFLAILAMPLAARAQGVPGGGAHGFKVGSRRWPVGAVA